MTQQVSVRPGPVTAAQVIIRVLAVIGAIGAALMIVLGIVGLVGGAAVASKASSAGAAGLGGAVGGLIGIFSGGFIVLGLISAAFVVLWFWLASALGKASRVAQIITTVLCGLDLLSGFFMLISAAGDREAAAGVLPAILMLAIPAAIIALLWAPESSRRYFEGVRTVPPMAPMAQGAWRPQYPAGQYPAQQHPMSPPVGFATPQAPNPQTDDALTGPIRLPAPRCGTCQAELTTGWGFCGTCGASVQQPQRPVGA
jgi:hypothetical protein